jgi:hypothetical protein
MEVQDIGVDVHSWDVKMVNDLKNGIACVQSAVWNAS